MLTSQTLSHCPLMIITCNYTILQGEFHSLISLSHLICTQSSQVSYICLNKGRITFYFSIRVPHTPPSLWSGVDEVIFFFNHGSPNTTHHFDVHEVIYYFKQNESLLMCMWGFKDSGRLTLFFFFFNPRPKLHPSLWCSWTNLFNQKWNFTCVYVRVHDTGRIIFFFFQIRVT